MGRIKDDGTTSVKGKSTGTTKKVVWSTKKVDEWMRDYSEGITHRENPWLDGMIGVRNPDIVFEYTPEEIQELTKCANDIFYFANKYGYCLQGSKGYQPLTLRDYQEEMLAAYVKNRFNITLSCRQIGKTVIAAIFILHYIIFNYDRHVAIAANKYATATEIMDKIKEMMNYLPFFMKPGVKINNISKMSFANGCRIEAQATTKRSFIGYTIHLLYLDEFAHVEPHILNEFYENIMPTVSSMEDSKIIVTSTPNGYNKFFDLYQGAIDGKNSFHPIRVDWWQVPGRDEKWKEKMIFDCGGEDEFMRQYGNSYLSTGNTLLSPDSLAKLQKNRVKYVYRELVELEKNWDEEFRNLKWHPDFNVEDLKNPKYMWAMSIDLAEGGGGDNSILNFFRLQPKPKELISKIDVKSEDYKKSDFFQLVQVGRFKSNTIDIPTLAKLVNIMTPRIINPDKIRIVCEYNAFGGEFLFQVQNAFGNNNNFDISTILKFKHSEDAKAKKYGLKVTASNKPVMCVNLKGLIADDGVVVTDDDTVGEFEVFSKVGNSWKASRDHDDLAMSVVDLTAIFDHPYFDVMMEEVMYEEGNEEIAKLFEEKIDEKFENIYDNNDYMNMNMNMNMNIEMRYRNDDFGNLFGSKTSLYK
jgi:hypothetical protein